jgi:hypothetical protein
MLEKQDALSVRGSAFAGFHPRKNALMLTIKADQPIKSARVAKVEQVSKNRWQAYEICA